MNKKNIILLVIGIIVFILIVIALILIVYKSSDLNSNNTVTNNSLENIPTVTGTVNEINKQGISNLETTYKNNGLEFNVEKDNIEFEQTDDEPRISMTKYEITGLKNKELQNKINSEIQSIIDLYRNNNCAITVNTSANFADVLSLSIYATSLEENSTAYRQLGLNYRLDTGEKLQFKDLFKDDKTAKEVLKESLEKKLATYENDKEIYQNMKTVNEAEIANFDGKQYEFTFSANKVNIYNIGTNETNPIIRNLSINLTDFADKVNIFTKYVSSVSLYEKENNSSDINAFMPLNKYSKIKELDENTYLIQYYAGDISVVDPITVEKIQSLADYEANRIKNQNSGYKVLVQNMVETTVGDKRYEDVNTSLYVLKPEYFNSNDFKLDIANGTIVEGMYVIDFNSDYIVYEDMFASREEL